MEQQELHPTYYERLKVPEDASASQIRHQYRRLAKGCHPDLNPDNPVATEQFRELHAAYSVLSNPEKRQAYDDSLWGRNRYKPGSYNYHYTHRNPPRQQGQPRRRTPLVTLFKPDKPRDAYFNYTVQLSIPELFKGARETLTIGQTHTCPRCRGKGVLGNGQQCSRCGGYTFLVSFEQLDLTIPPGVLPGTSIRAEVGQRHTFNRMFDVLYIDEVLIKIGVKEDESFTLDGQHLYSTVEVPANVLEEGGKWLLHAPEGGELEFNIPVDTASGTVLTLRRHGLKNGASQRRGNLYLTVMAGG